MQFLKFKNFCKLNPIIYKFQKKHKLINIFMEDTSKKISQERIESLSDMAHKLRIHSINMTDASASG